MSNNSTYGNGEGGTTEHLHLVTFTLLGEEFGLPITDVREIIRMIDITPVPQAPEFVEGVINLRGQIIPVVDMRKRFGIEAAERNKDNCIIVIDLRGMLVGLIVDDMPNIGRVPSDSVAPPPALVAGAIGSEYIKGITHHDDRMIILIDMRKVFTQEEMSALESV